MHYGIHISKMLLPVHIGVSRGERLCNTELVCDIYVLIDAFADGTDDISTVVDYDMLCGIARRFAGSLHFKLLESFVSQLIVELMQSVGIIKCTVRAGKKNLRPDVNLISVIMTAVKRQENNEIIFVAPEFNCPVERGR